MFLQTMLPRHAGTRVQDDGQTDTVIRKAEVLTGIIRFGVTEHATALHAQVDVGTPDDPPVSGLGFGR